MPLLIDCYNLLHAPKPPPLAGLDAAGLCWLLARSRWATQGVTVVCDGHVGPLGLTQSPEPSIELIYSGNRSADDVVIDLIQAHSAPRRLTVVSTDRQIRAAARRRRARAVTAAEFIGELTRLAVALQQRGTSAPAASPGDAPGLSTSQWLRTFGFAEEARQAEEDRRHPTRRSELTDDNEAAIDEWLRGQVDGELTDDP